MKVLASLTTLALAGTAVAQGAPQLPPCAQDCATGFLDAGIGDCGRGDVKCICSNGEFLDQIACCLVGVCSSEDQTKAVEFALQLCRGFDVNDLPSSVTCATAAPSTDTTAAPTATDDDAAPTTDAPTTSAPTSADAAATTETSSNLGPRPTAAAAGLGAIGGIMAAVALL
ncbi:hypothetical protein VTJ49DRAFT_1971 [Mycothermus thermophilus]|uniref:CFEM domain-containing protein n=1 Tax=Humicola insolens TaxID=85995 RepID=A0ABR3VNB7_HUMIN